MVKRPCVVTQKGKWRKVTYLDGSTWKTSKEATSKKQFRRNVEAHGGIIVPKFIFVALGGHI